MSKIPIDYVTEHFLLEDFRCPCCDMLKVVPVFFLHVERLEEMRQELGFPLVVNSGYRCEKHNKAVGGSPRSWHMIFATDIRPEMGEDEHALKEIYKVALTQNWGGIGLYEDDGFIHLDLRPEEVRWKV